MTEVAVAVILGSSLGFGMLLLLSIAPRWGAPSLSRRIAPYIRDVTDPLGLSLEPMRSAFDPASTIRAGVQRAARLLGGSVAIDRRLRQAGWTVDATTFRGRQLVWAVVGVGVGGVVVIVLVLTGRGSAAAAVVPVIGGAVGAMACDAVLTRAARARLARVAEELPTVLEFLALCLSAGEGILDSLRRVGSVGGGELTGEVRSAVVAVGTGSPLSESLVAMSRRVDLPALSRTVDQLVAALDRGAPLADVLHAQAQDAREDAKRVLIEQAGRKEIAMLLPLVFLILPLSILFAIFPGVFMLRLGIG